MLRRFQGTLLAILLIAAPGIMPAADRSGGITGTAPAESPDRVHDETGSGIAIVHALAEVAAHRQLRDGDADRPGGDRVKLTDGSSASMR